MRLARGIRLVIDGTSGRPVLLGPERGLFLDEVAHSIVRLLDGRRSLDDVVDALGARAPREVVRHDVAAFLETLRARRMLE